MKDTPNSKYNKGEIAVLLSLWRYLGSKRRWQFVALLLLTFLGVLAEIVSIGAIVPFLTALTTPEKLFEIEALSPLISFLGISEPRELLLPLTIGFIGAAFLSACMRILLLWFNSKLGAAMAVQLRSDLYKTVLFQSYEYHTANNSSKLISMATEKALVVITAGIMSVLSLINSFFMSFAVVFALLWINMTVALSAFAALSGSYILVAGWAKKKINRNGRVIAKYQPIAVKCMQEGIGGIRDIIMDSSQSFYSDLYRQNVLRVQKAGVYNGLLASVPKPVIETIGIALICIFAYWLQSDTSESNTLPILGALALGAQRLLPSLQQVYLSWSSINAGKASIIDVVEQLEGNGLAQKKTGIKQGVIELNENILVKNVDFHYAGHSDKRTLHNVSLNINKGSCIGFIGTTGSGKSTLLDIIMGLLRPVSGGLFVDKQRISDENIAGWQSNIAHVPQAIFLSDASLAENIAFGIPKEKINYNRVRLAAEGAQISGYIESLPQGYETSVGERGVRLSGGQRQRIGIARALYKQAQLMVFDEATSALDDETESKVMSAIDSLGDDLTIIMIAHRLSTLKNCDVIYKLEQGRIVEHGSYQSMVLNAI